MRRRRGSGEDGVVIVLVALLLVGLLGVAALVVDLAALRLDRRVDRAASDAAATAGATMLGADGSARVSCEAAWDYAVRNVGFDPATTSTPCGAFPDAACDVSTPVAVTASAGSYQITIANPVPDGSALMRAGTEGGSRAQPIDAAADGAPCDRVAVKIRLMRSFLFGRIFGRNGLATEVHSVARSNINSAPGRVLPSLVALEPTRCASVNAGTGEIYARAVADFPGRIYADSSATGAGCPYVFDVKNSGRIHALAASDGTPGELGHVADASRSFTSAGGASYLGTRLRLDAPVTRAPIDRQYHCTLLPSPCTSAQDPIADLSSRYGGNGAPSFPGPSSVFPGPGESCSSPPAVFAPGNWYVSCSSFNVGGTVTFGGNGVIVFNGSVSVGGTLNINGTSIAPAPANDAVVVIRGSGGLTVSSNGTFVAPRTTVFNVAGGLQLQGGPTVRWTAPSAGSLRNLLYWTESVAAHAIQGNPTLDMDGIIAMPVAKLSIGGNGYVDATNVQLWLRAVETQGSSTLLLRPNPNRAVTLGGAGSRLVR